MVLDHDRFPPGIFKSHNITISKVDKFDDVVEVWRIPNWLKSMENEHKPIVNIAHGCVASWLVKGRNRNPFVVLHVKNFD